MASSSAGRIELQPVNESKPVPQRRGQGSGSGRGPDEGKPRQIQLDRPGGRPLPDDEIELVVFHRRIERFLDGGRQSMDFIDEQHVLFLKLVRMAARSPAWLRTSPEVERIADAHLSRNDVGDGGLSKAWRAVKNGMVEGFAAMLGCLDADPQGLLHSRLADIFLQGLRAERGLDSPLIVGQLVGHGPVGHEKILCVKQAAVMGVRATV